MNTRNLFVLSTVLAACSPVKEPQNDQFDTLDPKSDRFGYQVKVAKNLGYGDSSSVLYKAPPYAAFTFSGDANDKITLDVTSTNGDAVTWLLDAGMNILAQNDDADSSTTASHIDATLPMAGMYYVVVRDYYKASHYFTVKLGGTSSSRHIDLTEAKCTAGNKFYAGGEIPTPEDVALDAYCGEVILHRLAPKGDIVFFGSSRLKDGTPEYALAHDIAFQWTQARPDLPIMTGGGPGLMEAGNKGAKDAGGVSLGFSTYFKDANDKLNDFVTDGYMFSDFPVRERALLKYAKAAVVFPGGVGTAWELFMSMSEVQTHRMNKIPIIVVTQSYGDATKQLLQWMSDKGTISPDDMNLITVVNTAADAVAALQAALPH
jgi:uncharacterized protein (TIGR00730 family)